MCSTVEGTLRRTPPGAVAALRRVAAGPTRGADVRAGDAYHAMTSDGPYRAALPEAEARAELARHAGTQFDPAVVAALLDVVGRQTQAG